MKTLPMIVLITVFPVASFAGTGNVDKDFEQAQITANTDVELKGSPEIARCTGTKCAGPGDTIRNEQGILGTQRVADNRGGQVTSGDKKGSRKHREKAAMPLVAGNRGGQSSAGTKKGPRHTDTETLAPVRVS